jgi:hypothetical protein
MELKNDYDMQPIKQQYFSIPANIQVTNKSKKHTSRSASSNSTLDNINEKTKAPAMKLVAQKPEVPKSMFFQSLSGRPSNISIRANMDSMIIDY